jgi:hypothetical protein
MFSTAEEEDTGQTQKNKKIGGQKMKIPIRFSVPYLAARTLLVSHVSGQRQYSIFSG